MESRQLAAHLAHETSAGTGVRAARLSTWRGHEERLANGVGDPAGGPAWSATLPEELAAAPAARQERVADAAVAEVHLEGDLRRVELQEERVVLVAGELVPLEEAGRAAELVAGQRLAEFLVRRLVPPAPAKRGPEEAVSKGGRRGG